MPGRDPEVLIRQALRAQAGGPRRPDLGAADETGRGDRFGRFTTTQLVLLAAIVGVVFGMAAGFVVLLAP